MSELQVVDSYQRVHRATLNEYNVALALQTCDLLFMFQVDFFGGRSLRGGQVLDFLVFNPMPTPVQVFGDHWHEGQLGTEDSYKLSLIQEQYGRDVVIFFQLDTDTYDHALAAVKGQLL